MPSVGVRYGERHHTFVGIVQEGLNTYYDILQIVQADSGRTGTLLYLKTSARKSSLENADSEITDIGDGVINFSIYCYTLAVPWWKE